MDILNVSFPYPTPNITELSEDEDPANFSSNWYILVSKCKLYAPVQQFPNLSQLQIYNKVRVQLQKF